MILSANLFMRKAQVFYKAALYLSFMDMRIRKF